MMQQRQSVWLVLALGFGAALCCAAEPASQPASQPAGQVFTPPANPTLEQAKALWDAHAGAQPEAATYKNVEEILHATLEEGFVKVDTASLRSFEGMGGARVKVETAGPDTVWGVVAMPQRGRYMITRYDWDQSADGQLWNAGLSVRNFTNSVLLQIDARGNGIEVKYTQTQVPGTASLQVTTPVKWGVVPDVIFDASSPNLRKLKQEHPSEVRQYLEPLIKRLTGKDLLRPGPAEFYSVLTEIPADAKATAALKDLLPQLDADVPDQRQAASAELAKLGRPGVLAVLRMDLTPLSEEQKARLHALVNSFRQAEADDDPGKMRQDPHFFLDAMEDDEAQVRTAAKNQLQKLLGHAVKVDVLAANEDARFKAMTQLRNDIEKELAAKGPTTKPT